MQNESVGDTWPIDGHMCYAVQALLAVYPPTLAQDHGHSELKGHCQG